MNYNFLQNSNYKVVICHFLGHKMKKDDNPYTVAKVVLLSENNDYK